MSKLFTEGVLRRPREVRGLTSVSREHIHLPKKYWTVAEARELRDWLDVVLPKDSQSDAATELK